ncbi:metalloendopeptidase [Desmophyllum pertusum]|uniref:Metalloendopeptidase n=1 Tax=Desmophyllum pertusum TaxID=174260 RepID=A0A9W9YIH2_9CNID|nr:metalloendopeptidase [Desmophyllum pertusum]
MISMHWFLFSDGHYSTTGPDSIPAAIASHLVSDSNRNKNSHLVYRRSLDEKKILSKAREMEDPNFEDESLEASKIKRSDSDLKYLEMTLVADKYTIAFHGKDTAKYLLMITNLVNRAYHDESIGAKKLTISIVQIKLVIEGLSYDPTSSNPIKLKAIKEWADAVNFSPSDSHPNHPDAIALISRGGSGGYADYNTICKGDKGISFSVNNDMGFGTVIILAHETAHMLGVSHDSSGSCPNNQYVMATAVPGGSLAFKWSSCSREKIQTLLR